MLLFARPVFCTRPVAWKKHLRLLQRKLTRLQMVPGAGLCQQNNITMFNDVEH
ncbi:hypothetical protein NB701_002618 [Pantoea ananatis]|nr:hypothetical protein [Pantoea ananatis]MCW0349256.1 hypothetical protein [Pantoea ananatis]MCW0353712.1 hypothetical protein [Pantoea ananatis]